MNKIVVERSANLPEYDKLPRDGSAPRPQNSKHFSKEIDYYNALREARTPNLEMPFLR